MSKILVTIDTTEKTMTATVDGKDIPNLCEVNSCCYSEDGYFMCSLKTMEEEGDLKKMSYMMAADSEEGKRAIRNGASNASIPGFVVASTNNALQDEFDKCFGYGRS